MKLLNAPHIRQCILDDGAPRTNNGIGAHDVACAWHIGGTVGFGLRLKLAVCADKASDGMGGSLCR
eukprot:scaffold56807_cov51-Attheya_sp.AAC.3